MLKLAWIVALGSIISATLAITVATQNSVVRKNDLVQRQSAQSAFTNKDWAESKKYNLAIIADQPDDPDAWFNLGLSQHFLGNLVEARESFIKSKELGHDPGIIHYNLGCGYNLLGERELALKHLQIANDLQFPVANYAAEDKDLQSLINDPEFQKIFSYPPKR